VDGASQGGENCDGDFAAGWGELIAVCASDLGNQAVSAEQPELSSHPRGTAPSLTLGPGGRGEEKWKQVAVAEAADVELAARDCGQQGAVIREGAKATDTVMAPGGVLLKPSDQLFESGIASTTAKASRYRSAAFFEMSARRCMSAMPRRRMRHWKGPSGSPSLGR
jgi:hypothetical protein